MPSSILTTTAADTTPLPSTTTTTVRHAGRTLIRGKIRRIWRPRYLQLCDTGLVRYYELHEEDASPLSSDVPKCTVAVHSARIIDVTTLRDMHVGLPIASFGFVFSGHRLYQPSSSPQSNTYPISKSTADDIFANTHTDVLLLEACHPPELQNAPRDFLCAVDTLEEAQSWVVALQWASQRVLVDSLVTNDTPSSRTFPQVGLHDGVVHDNRGTRNTSTKNTIDGWEEDDDLFSMASTVRQRTSPARRRRRTASNDAFQVIDDDGDVVVSTHAQSPSRSVTTTTTKKKRSRKSSGKAGKIIVTKVGSVQLIRRTRTSLDVAYHIAVLLIRQKMEETLVEERTMLRTPEDLRIMLEALQYELDLNQEGRTSSRTPKAVITARRACRRVQVTMDAEVPSSGGPYSYNEMKRSLLAVDGCLRTLAMNGFICNSQALRQFWSLGEATERQSLWAVHVGSGLYGRRQLARPDNTEEFVKAWLQQDDNADQSAVESIVWLSQRPSMVIGGVACLVLLLGPVLACYEQFMIAPRIRLDMLLVSWIALWHAGRTFERIRRVQQRPMTEIGAAVHFPREVEVSTKNVEAMDELLMDLQSATTEEDEGPEDLLGEGQIELDESPGRQEGVLSSPLPQYPNNGGTSCWSKPLDDIFNVRGANYLNDRVKIPSAPAPFRCRGVDIWLTDNAERHIARHPSVLGGKLGEEHTFLVNFLLPFGNFVAYFAVPPIEKFPPKLANVWRKFLHGDQEYRDARLKLLPVVVDGPWIVRTAVGPGTSPALLGKVIPLQYYFRAPSDNEKGVYEVDVIITASRIAKGILSVVKGHTKSLTIAFALIIEAAEAADLPETVLCTFQMHAIHLEDCPQLPDCNLDEIQ